MYTFLLWLSGVLGWNTPRSDPLRRWLGSYRHYAAIAGRIGNGRYFAPHKRFSCRVPALFTPGAVVTDSFMKGKFNISFSDDMGRLYIIEGTEDSLQRDPGLSTRQRNERALARRLLALPKTTQVIDLEYLDDVQGGSLWALTSMPGATSHVTLDGSGTPRWPASTHGFLLFEHSAMQLQLDVRPPALEISCGSANDAASDHGGLREQVVAWACSFEFSD